MQFAGQVAYFHAQLSSFVFVTTDKCATCEMEARASPRKPYVFNFDKSEKLEIFEVVKRSARMGRSAFWASRSSAVSRQACSSTIATTHPDAAPVILDLKKLQPAILHCHAYGGRSGIQAVFKQLFQC